MLGAQGSDKISKSWGEPSGVVFILFLVDTLKGNKIVKSQLIGESQKLACYPLKCERLISYFFQQFSSFLLDFPLISTQYLSNFEEFEAIYLISS